ncbi:hypothetical protein FKM82_004637 [Ascaphus truei]
MNLRMRTQVCCSSIQQTHTVPASSESSCCNYCLLTKRTVYSFAVLANKEIGMTRETSYQSLHDINVLSPAVRKQTRHSVCSCSNIS